VNGRGGVGYDFRLGVSGSLLGPSGPERVYNNIWFYRKDGERSEVKILLGLLSYFSLIWLHKIVPFFSKEQRTQGKLFFLQKCEIDYFSQQILSSDYIS